MVHFRQVCGSNEPLEMEDSTKPDEPSLNPPSLVVAIVNMLRKTKKHSLSTEPLSDPGQPLSDPGQPHCHLQR